ncbi:uncharacterized protein LOC131293483 [Anopheles ziemanni]|uniref:uncharacterized protein LOC131264288 n=1 Tax=Anopheles coustani TaxID=139045 RepID=UPI002657F43A|nr:uncharacterized protein LOC131264288 [Anopheles coustani]XP_058177544.1 uncharacterized protein LOC131293483 [Anopheles ziemanni]
MGSFSRNITVAVLSLVQLFHLAPICNAQTVTDCLRRVPESSRGKICDIRQYHVTARGDDADRYLSCALAAIRFVGEDGSVQRNVLLSALDEVETHDGVYTDSVDACLSKTRKLTGTERPGAFFACMLATESAQNFKDALELQELKVGGQWTEGEAFDGARVHQLVQEVNRKLQCK